jgi:hypothetical protein
MDKGDIQCHPTGRVPKSDTATGLPTSKGRLIAHLSFQPVKFGLLKYLSKNQSVDRPFGTYNLAKHQDIARLWCQARGNPLASMIAAQKNDGNYYFKNWYFAVMCFGEIASEFAGNTVMDRSLVFGLKPAPEITHFGGTEPIEKATSAGWVSLGRPVAELARALHESAPSWDLKQQEEAELTRWVAGTELQESLNLQE